MVRLVPSLSLGTASGWFSGHHVPTRASEPTLEQVLDLLGETEDTTEWLAAVERVRSRPGPRRAARRRTGAANGDPGTEADAAPDPSPVDPPDDGSPYVGLRPYGLGDAALFHGRGAEVEHILQRVASHRSRPLVVIGASGSGKSSLLAAGVAPRWSAEGSPVMIVRPEGLTEELVDAPGYLVVDQLEELWSEAVSVDRRGLLLELIGRRASAGRPTVVVLRADFFQPALAEPALRDALDDPVVIGPPSRDQLAEIIVQPARSLGFTVEPSLVSLLLDTVAPADSGLPDRALLPLLSYVLLECWDRSRRRRITVADYYASGGVEGAVRTSAEVVYQDLDPAGREACHQLFLRLVDVSTERALRRRAPLEELADELVVVATPFAQAGLLTVDGDSVTPTHEVLFSSWPRLVDWIDADREGLRVLARLRSDAADWEASGRGEAALPTASATADYLRWRDDDGPGTHLADSEFQFLTRAEAHHEALARTDRRRIRALTLLAASLAVVTVLALVATGFALSATSDARLTRDVALSRSGSVSSTTAFTSDPALGRALALAAYRIHPTTEARSALLNTSRADVPQRFPAAAGTGQLEDLPEPGWFASVSSDGTLRTFNDSRPDPVASLTLSTAERHELYGVDLHPDGTVLAAAGQGGVFLVDARDPGEPALLVTLETESGPFYSVAFSPDGTTLAAGTGDGRVLRWPVASPDDPEVVAEKQAAVATPDPGTEQPKPVESMAWLPDSETLLVTNRTSHVKSLLDAHAGGSARRGPALDTGADALPLSVAVAPDGTRVAAGTTGRSVHRWALEGDDLDDARALPRLTGWNAYVSDVDYDARGRLAAAGTDERLRVYDPAGTPLTELPASQVATGVRFSDEDTLISYSLDGLVRRWSLDRLGAATETNSVFQTASSKDRTTGALGVTASELHYTVVDTTGPVPRETGRVIPDDDTRFSGSLAMAPDGRAVYAGLADGGVQVFTAPFGPATRSAAALSVVSGVVVASPLSPDGRTLAVCSDTDPTLALLDVSDPDRPELRAAVQLPDPCVVAEFSSDSRQLVVPTLGPETLVVDTSNPGQPEVAHRLTTGIGGATTDPLLYQGRSASPDGGLLAVGAEGAMWMWQLDPDDVVDEACSGGVQLTDEEWARHFPDTEPFDLCD